jgi:hypothetical protein
MSDDIAEVRDQKAWRRVIAAARKLAKQHDVPELGEEVASANHADTATRDMRRSEALATLLEAVVKDEPKGSVTNENADAKTETKSEDKSKK